MKYKSTITLENENQIISLHIGQWYKLGKCGNKAQYLGTTKHGTIIVRHGKFNKPNAMRNRLLRQYAIRNGSK